MKNVLAYYYNLNSNDIHQNGKIYRFQVETAYYVLLPYERTPEELKEIYDLSLELFSRNIYVHQMVMNRNQELITMINGIPYILLQTFVAGNDIITLQDIAYFSNISSGIAVGKKINREQWYSMWTSKIDYFEYQISQFGKKNPIIRDSFSYFVGLAETGIALLKDSVVMKDVGLGVAHKRIKMSDTIFDLYNPLNLIIDVKVRDTAEYFKQRFLISPDLMEEIKHYFFYYPLNDLELRLFFIRMVYPSHYFDLYEEVIGNNIEEKSIVPIVAEATRYETFLKDLYHFIRQYAYLPDIEWLAK